MNSDYKNTLLVEINRLRSLRRIERELIKELARGLAISIDQLDLEAVDEDDYPDHSSSLNI